MAEFRLNFKKFIDSDWLRWKNQILREAEEETAAKFPGGEATLRQPILFDEEDWKFLSQFPPNFWARAINWRYGEGLLQAAEKRERSKNKDYEAVPNEAKSLEFTDNSGKKFIFPNVYVGLRDLMEKLEKPAIPYMGYKPNIESIPYKFDTPDGPSLDDLNFSDEEMKDLKDPKDYKGGMYDMDLTKPIMLSKKFVDALPDDHYLITQIDPKAEYDPEAAKAARVKLAKGYANSFASMPAMRYEVAVDQLQNWIRASGLGLLGDAPMEVKGVGNKTNKVLGNAAPSEFYGKWPASVGKQDGARWDSESGPVEARAIPLNLPFIKKNIFWFESDRSGKELKRSGGEVRVPVLMPGKLLPLISPTAEQREALKSRRGRKDDTGQVGELRQVLDNWDLFSQEQKDAFASGTMTLTELLARKLAPNYAERFGKGSKRRGEDFYAVGGWHSQKAQRGRASLNMSKKQLEAVLEQYFPADSEKLKLDWGSYKDAYCEGQGGFIGEACRGVTYFMKKDLDWKGYQARRSSATPGKFEMAKASVLKMMEQGLPDIISTAAALLTLSANNPRLGVYDPDIGLNVDFPELGEPDAKKRLSVARTLSAFNVARDLAQAAMFGGQSRRQRASGKGYELTGGGSEEGNFGDDIAAGADMDDIIRRRQELGAGGGIKQNRTWYAYRSDVAARPQWLVPTLTPKLTAYLETLRTEIQSRLDSVAGTNLAQNVTSIAEISALIDKTTNQMIEQKLKELEEKGLIDKDSLKDNPEKIRELLDKSISPEKLEAKLRKDYPKVFGQNITSEKLKEIMGSRRSGEATPVADTATSMEDILAQQSLAVPEQIERVLSGFSQLQYDLQDVNEKFFVKPLMAGNPGSLYVLSMDNKSEDDPPILGIDINQELPGREPEIVVYDKGITGKSLAEELDDFKGIRNLFALMGYTKSEAAKVIPEFLQKVFGMNPQQVSQEMQKMGFAGTVTPAAPSPTVAPTPVGAAANIINQVGQWIITPSETETFKVVAQKLQEVLNSGFVTPEDLQPYYQQIYNKVQQDFQDGKNPTSKDLAIIRYLGTYF